VPPGLGAARRPGGARPATAAAGIAAALLSLPAAAEPVTYRLDPEHSFIHFEVLHFGTSTLRGRFGPAQGEVVLDRERRSGEVSLQLRSGSLDTGVPVLDKRLCAADLFNCAAEPQIYFVARRFEFEGNTVRRISGELTLRGESRGLTLRASRFGCHPHPDSGVQVCGGDFEGEVRRSDFGMTFGLPFVSDTVRLRVQVEGLRQ
jgi:polyisoprenoid-binding protein YceI